jgi:hypothetical protein
VIFTKIKSAYRDFEFYYENEDGSVRECGCPGRSVDPRGRLSLVELFAIPRDDLLRDQLRSAHRGHARGDGGGADRQPARTPLLRGGPLAELSGDRHLLYDIGVPIVLIWYWFTFFRDARRTTSDPSAPVQRQVIPILHQSELTI